MIQRRPHLQKLTSARRRAARQGTMLPQLFAIHTGRPTYRYDFGSGSSNSDPDMVPDYTTGRVAIFQARHCHDGRGGGGPYDPWILRDVPHATYRIAPYRIHTGNGEERDRISAFVLEGRFGSSAIPSDGPVTLYSEDRGPPTGGAAASRGYYEDYYEPPRDRTSIYRGHWRYSGYTVFSMYCATPIPILVFTDGGREEIEWPAPYYNRIAVAEGDRTILRVWAQRWDPASWEATIEDAYAEQEARRSARRSRDSGAAAASGGGGGGRAAAPPAPAAPPPKFVADLIIADAVAKGATCPITMEPLKADKVTVTSCYHVFDTDALNTWAAAQIATGEAVTTVCPQCRKGL